MCYVTLHLIKNVLLYQNSMRILLHTIPVIGIQSRFTLSQHTIHEMPAFCIQNPIHVKWDHSFKGCSSPDVKGLNIKLNNKIACNKLPLLLFEDSPNIDIKLCINKKKLQYLPLYHEWWIYRSWAFPSSRIMMDKSVKIISWLLRSVSMRSQHKSSCNTHPGACRNCQDWW